ncbi:EutN/CcmL family microcompartment protein [Sulfuriroseicoccus oceanibius]|uniref:Uncharacterized protein n=1 Tax=Sulfuriroseicoccus oceanibius TaxID=2707525 RepID=A0A6B3LBL2_9BACT|nr:EutN/CcmL family microcompartment protein [Sulfuriroseicoccus oceanibius]QQL44563.1 hypothetical protein G3M56_011830 [Sulfuriroseicoccus oceanibius]
MNTQEPSLDGGRWLLVNPVDAGQLNDCLTQAPAITAQPTLVVYDAVGAGQGDIIGFVEGAEAAAPFDRPTPIDAISVTIFDSIHYQPVS